MRNPTVAIRPSRSALAFEDRQHGEFATHVLQDLSNFGCLPGRAGGSPNGLGQWPDDDTRFRERAHLPRHGTLQIGPPSLNSNAGDRPPQRIRPYLSETVGHGTWAFQSVERLSGITELNVVVSLTRLFGIAGLAPRGFSSRGYGLVSGLPGRGQLWQHRLP